MKALLPFMALLLLCSCLRGAASGALLNLAVGAGASAVSRSQGGCYASCPTGTTCNPKTGYCETLPCHGQCGPKERCDTSAVVERCVRETPDLEIQGSDAETRKVRLTPP